jgi:hypothetical protein
MRIANNDSKMRSAFVYNQEDTSRAIALASKPLGAGETWDYDPPKNGSGFYTVLLHHDKGGGLIMAIGSGDKGATLSFNGLTLCGPC